MKEPSDPDLDDENKEQASMNRARPSLTACMKKRIPKIKVCHKTEEFTVLSAIMSQLNAQKVVSSVTNNDESVSGRNENSRQGYYPPNTFQSVQASVASQVNVPTQITLGSQAIQQRPPEVSKLPL